MLLRKYEPSGFLAAQPDTALLNAPKPFKIPRVVRANLAQLILPELNDYIAETTLIQERAALVPIEDKTAVRYIFQQPFAEVSADTLVICGSPAVNIYLPANAAAVNAPVGYTHEFFAVSRHPQQHIITSSFSINRILAQYVSDVNKGDFR